MAPVTPDHLVAPVPEPAAAAGGSPVPEPATAGGGALEVQQEVGDDPYADDDAELPRHVVVRINGVTLQLLALFLWARFIST